MSIVFRMMIFSLIITNSSYAQELYVFTEPASNMPARSLSVKYTAKMLHGDHSGRFEQRHTPELMFGLNKRIMIHGVTTFSDMYSSNVRWESARLYGKYRFYSDDDVHRHFRMAAFAELSHSVNEPQYDELSLEGDYSGWQGGVIFTQLIKKLAISSTVSYLHATSVKNENSTTIPDKAFNYTLSAGYLVFPMSYSSYNQLNFNVYAELLGQQALNGKGAFIDFAPAIQFIINSTAKLNLGYRTQLGSTSMHRMSNDSWLVAFEYTFLNALKRKKQHVE
jgi:hypothetical protein